MPIRNSREIPKVQARHRWAFNIKAGVDIESTLGLPNQVTNLAVLTSNGQALPTIGGSSGLGKLMDVGTIEQVDVGQSREVTQRFGFNADPTQPFQVAPHGSLFTLKLTRIALKVLPEVEASFEFFPSNLLMQQLPFVIEMIDSADGNPDNFIRHYAFGCWFVGKSARYDVNSREDTRLIEVADVKPGRVLTFDPSFAGNWKTQSASAALGIAFQAAQSNAAAANQLENFNLT